VSYNCALDIKSLIAPDAIEGNTTTDGRSEYAGERHALASFPHTRARQRYGYWSARPARRADPSRRCELPTFVAHVEFHVAAESVEAGGKRLRELATAADSVGFEMIRGRVEPAPPSTDADAGWMDGVRA
jgi:hypothetical protein